MVTELVSLGNVGLKFQLYSDKGATLKETLVNKFLRRHVSGKSEFWALDDVSIGFSAGERVGIIGNNGAGKSTLLKLVTGIYQPTVGTVSIRGKVAPLIELGAGFNPELSGYENIFLNGAIMGIPRKQMKDKVESIVEFADIREFMNMPIKYYSTGMYLRLAFSIATEIAPDILVIDELFAGGDITFVKRAEKRLNDLMDSSQVVIMVSHSMDLIRKNCNRVILIQKGRLVADGDPDSVIGLYSSEADGAH